jgi:hypothetical protein
LELFKHAPGSAGASAANAPHARPDAQLFRKFKFRGRGRGSWRPHFAFFAESIDPKRGSKFSSFAAVTAVGDAATEAATVNATTATHARGEIFFFFDNERSFLFYFYFSDFENASKPYSIFLLIFFISV